MDAGDAEVIKQILHSSEFMLSLLNDLLDLAKIESGRLDLELETTRLQEFLQEVVQVQKIIAAKKSISIVVDSRENEPINVRIDRHKITQVVNNLVSNAIKYSLPGTRIMVSTFDTDGDAIVSIKDEGQGIPADELEALFTAFNKTSTKPTAGEKSTGLGLAIAKKVVLGHGGRIWVTSEVGVGTTFYFSLQAVPRERK